MRLEDPNHVNYVFVVKAKRLMDLYEKFTEIGTSSCLKNNDHLVTTFFQKDLVVPTYELNTLLRVFAYSWPGAPTSLEVPLRG